MLNACFNRISQRFVRPILLICLFIIQLFYMNTSFAWNDLGHMVMAQIAYDKLTPEVKKKVSRLSYVLGNYFPSYASFVSSAAWADAIKDNGIKAFNNWHFINQRFSYVRMRLPKYIPRENVVWAVQQSENVLNNKTANPFEKSLFLRFLINFTADAHQPTQCANFYSWKFPKGDNGGTKYPIDSVYAKNLHDYWESGLGLYVNDKKDEPIGKEVKQLAQTIETKYPPSYFGKRIYQSKPQTWANESLSIARSFVYRNLKPGAQPSETYITKGRDIVEQRTALAGYRLANLLEDIFGGQANSDTAKTP